MDTTADDFVTRITEATPENAQIVVSTLSLRMLREIADLTYACDDPESHGRAFLRNAILAAIRA